MIKFLVIADQGYSSDWYVEFINVNVHGKDVYFPCYEWVTDGFSTPNSKTALPHHEENDALKQFRSKSLLKEKSKHAWAEAEDIVGHMTGHLAAATVDELEKNYRWATERIEEKAGRETLGIANLLVNKFIGVFKSFDSLEDVEKATDFN